MPTFNPEDHYRGARGQAYHLGKRAIPECARRWVARSRAAKLAPFIRPSDAVLEYGVGAGWNLLALHCRRKVGLDVAEFFADDLRREGIEFVTGAAGLAAESFEVVICHHMLEHALNPAGVLSDIHRLLRPGGRLLLFVPFEKERRHRSFRADEPNHHLYSWNAQTLGNLARECAYDIEQLGPGKFRLDRFAAVWSARWGWGEAGFRLIRGLGLMVAPEYEWRLVGRKAAATLATDGFAG